VTYLSVCSGIEAAGDAVDRAANRCSRGGGVKIQGPLGGNRVGYIGARLVNGTLGPRLPGAPPRQVDDTDVPEAGADYLLGKARYREQAKRDRIPDPEMGDSDTTERRPWSDADNWTLVKRVIEGVTMGRIAAELGRSTQAATQRLSAIRKGLERLTPSERGVKGGEAMRGKKHGHR